MEYKVSGKTTILFIITLAITLRLVGLDKSFQGDEFFSVMNAGNFKNIPYALLADTHPPLYFYLLHFWMKISMNEAFLRLLSVISGVGICLAAYFIGKETFGTGAGIAGSLVIAVSPAAVWSSQYIRTYSLAGFFTVLSIYFLIKLIKERKGPGPLWVFFILSSAFGIYTFYFSALFIAAENIFVLLFMRGDRRFIARWVLSQLAIAALCIPWLPFFVYQRSSYIAHPQMLNTAGFYIGDIHVGGIMRSAAGLSGLDPRFLAKGLLSASSILKTMSVILVSAGTVLMVWLVSKYPRPLKENAERLYLRLFLVLAIAPFAMALVLHQTLKIIVMSHYLLASFVFLTLYLAVILKEVCPKKIRIFMLILILVIYGARLGYLYGDREMDFKAARDYVRKAMPEGANIVSPSFGGMFEHYFFDIPKKHRMDEPAAFKIFDKDIVVISYPGKLELKKCDELFRKSLASRHYSLGSSRRFGDLVVERYNRLDHRLST